MHIAIIIFEGFSEIDTFILVGMLNRVKDPDWRVSIAAPTAQVKSMNGVTIESQSTLEEANLADVVIIGGGDKARENLGKRTVMERLKLDPAKQIIAAQCSGVLILDQLHYLNLKKVSTNVPTKNLLAYTDEIEVLPQPFYAEGNMATAGGCFASHYLASWIIARVKGLAAARFALFCVAPSGEPTEFIEHALTTISPYL